MKKNIVTILATIICGVYSAQVGVNTKNPQGAFHIDAAKDNPATGNTLSFSQQNNDVIIMSSGNLGVGTITPDTKLDIRTVDPTVTPAVPVAGFRLVDGNQAAGRVLQTDANGLSTWGDIGNRPVLLGKIGVVSAGPVYSDKDPTVVAANPYKYANTGITLTPGRYVLNIGMSIYLPVDYPIGYSYYLPVYLSSDNTSTTSLQQNGFTIVSGGASGNAAFGGRMIRNYGNTSLNMIQGSLVVDITATTTLYVYLKNIPVFTDVPSTNGLTSYRWNTGNYENYFYALPINK